MELDLICAELKKGAAQLALHTELQKNNALKCVSEAILKNKQEILNANQIDVENARAKGTSESLVERLALNEKKFNDILDGIKIVIQQKDPVGKIVDGWKAPNGMEIRQIRVPLGVAAIIYESRPNVTADAFALAYKSGNAILLRGSSSAINSNLALEKAIKQGLKNAENGVEEAISLAPCKSHEEVEQILTAVGKVDVALPRGGAKLINMVVQTAKVPVIQTGAGICHLYVDESADLEMALNLAWNAKTQRPGACNAIETIVVNEKILNQFIPRLVEKFAGKVELRLDEKSYNFLQNVQNPAKIKKAADEDFGFEFLDFICSVKTVSTLDEAIDFINSHNTKHSECIVTNNRQNSRIFQSKIDAACVYVNASTRFTDGGEFGFGAELGISTQKLHARGPMGIKALTTTKYLIDGDGQIR